MSIYRADFGNRIKELRKNRKLTQQDLAEILGITQSYMSDLEKGANISNDKLVKLADALGTSVDYLLYGGDSQYQEEEKLPTDVQDFAFWLSAKNVSKRDLEKIKKLVLAYIEED